MIFQFSDGTPISRPTGVPGLFYFPKIVPVALSKRVEEFLSSPVNEWFPVGKTENSRKVLQYGFYYDYTSGSTKRTAPPFPDLIKELRDVVDMADIVDSIRLNQCIINAYKPGQGISAHTDSLQYGSYVCCFTFGSGAEMEFCDGEEIIKLYTEPNSLYIMKDDARYRWKHEMKSRKSDTVDGKKVARGERISVTFRIA